MRVAHRSAIPAEVDRIHYRQRAPDTEDESEKKSDDGGKREVHTFDDVTPGSAPLAPAVLRVTAVYPEDDE